MPRNSFDASYYARFYSSLPVHTKKKVAELATAVHAMCGWWDVRVRSVLDVGSGPGYWRDWYRDNHPRVRVQSIDVSEHACSRYGHDLRDISEWAPAKPFDLVVCQGVLQYVNDAAASRAIANLSTATRHVLYLEIPTVDDRTHVVDVDATDMEIHWRTGEWYRRRLKRHFTQAGAGLWVTKSSGIALYELERSSND